MTFKRFWVALACAGFAAYHSLGAPESARLRSACFDTLKLPKVIVPLDVKRTQNAIPSLSADAFHLLEDGGRTSVADRIVRFRDANMGLALIVALDASGSMKGRPMAAIQRGLAQLVSRKRSEDRIAVLSFADDARWETRWDASDQANQDAFRNLQTRGNLTRLYDALEEANSEFTSQAEKDEAFPLRRCILVISDGHDEGSHTNLPKLQSDLAISRVRLDAVGLAHSPLWLGSLRQLARVGFGEFQTAATPEDLTDLLGKGIDSLLDMPTLEFQAERLQADGKTHQIGIDYAVGGLRDQISLKLPEPFWRTKHGLYYVAGGLALIILSGLLLWRFRSPKASLPPAPIVQAQPVPTSPPVPPPLRAATVAEPGSRIMRSSQSTPAISYVTPTLQVNTVAKPVRVQTALAPNPANAPLKLGLAAVSGPYTGLTFPVTEQEFWIGSAANNHLCLSSDDSASGNHVCIRREESFYRLYDNGSLNNTWLNGQAIGREITLIQPGDRIRIGASDFLVEANGDT